MEDNFRNTLIIISAVIIGAIFAHGLWTIRKNKNPYKLKASKDKVAPISRNFDHGGFDQDGVGQIKVKPQDSEVNESIETGSELEPAPDMRAVNVDSLNEPSNGSITESASEQLIEPTLGSLELPSFDALEKTMEEISADANQSVDNQTVSDNKESATDSKDKKVLLEEVISEKPVYSQPVSRPKVKTKAELKKDQIEINFGNETGAKSMPSMSALDDEKIEKKEIQPEVLALSVVMPQNQVMHGASLLPLLLTLGLKYGEMNIFHRHQDNAGNGPVTFSLANMMNPGSFDLDSIETFATQGITLFMMLPNAGNAFDVYRQMLSAAKQVSEEFSAQILDDKRNVMTKQTEQHYESRIRDFEIKNRTAAG